MSSIFKARLTSKWQRLITKWQTMKIYRYLACGIRQGLKGWCSYNGIFPSLSLLWNYSLTQLTDLILNNVRSKCSLSPHSGRLISCIVGAALECPYSSIWLMWCCLYDRMRHLHEYPFTEYAKQVILSQHYGCVVTKPPLERHIDDVTYYSLSCYKQQKYICSNIRTKLRCISARIL